MDGCLNAIILDDAVLKCTSVPDPSAACGQAGLKARQRQTAPTGGGASFTQPSTTSKTAGVRGKMDGTCHTGLAEVARDTFCSAMKSWAFGRWVGGL